MKVKELITLSENKKNKQINLCIKKKKLKKSGLSINDLLNTKLGKIK